MVRPYLWRFSPTEPGPGLRPRPRSRFEPAPRLPIDGPAIEGRSVSWPPTSDAETAGVEIEVEQDAPSGELPSHGEHRPAPRAEQRLSPYSERTTQQPPEKPLSTGSFVGNSRGSAPESGQEASVRPTIGEVAVRRPLAPPSATPHPGPSRSASHQAEPAPIQGPAAQASPPTSRQVLTPAPQQIPPSEPGQGPPPAPRRQVDRPSPPGPPAPLPTSAPAEAQPRVTINPQPADKLRADELPADHIQAVARSLRYANAYSAGPEATKAASTDPALPPPPPPAPSRLATHTDVSVTIGRIEVTAPAADPVPAQPRSSAPRRRPPTLAEYLEVRTRARGRAG